MIHINSEPWHNFGFFELDLARGKVDGFSYMNKFGRNATVGAIEDIWDLGSDYQYATSTISLELLTSGADSVAGTGARVVTVIGLDDNWAVKTEDVNTNAATVYLTKQYRRIYRAYVKNAGSGGINATQITIQGQGGGIQQAAIMVGMGQTLMAIYTIPAGYTGYLCEWNASLNKALGTVIGVNILLFTRDNGITNPSWQLKDIHGLTSGGTSDMKEDFCIPLRYPEKTDIRLRADATGAIDVSAGFTFTLIPNA